MLETCGGSCRWGVGGDGVPDGLQVTDELNHRAAVRTLGEDEDVQLLVVVEADGAQCGFGLRQSVGDGRHGSEFGVKAEGDVGFVCHRSVLLGLWERRC
ncbi:hypothetical protein GCM10020295_36730 [Streptomyces cinereospinus]